MNKMKPLFLALIMLTASLAGCLGGETEILDDDEDGIADNLDLCAGTGGDRIVDADGCAENQLDDDDDGIRNNADLCPDTPPNDDANGNGCADSELDADEDGVMKNLDLCPNTPAGETFDTDGCSQSQLDDDADSVMNNLDLCPNTPAEAWVDLDGCIWEQLDDDGDGVINGVDLCAYTVAGETFDTEGCSQSQLDDDGDGVMNNLDLCPNTPAGESSNVYGHDGYRRNNITSPLVFDESLYDINSPILGCSQSEYDDDADDVWDDVDLCPLTPTGETVDADGCSQSQLDDDGDGVMNNLDLCALTPAGETVDVNGCSQSQLDDDNDGIMNGVDQCLNTSSGSNVDATGCGNYNDVISAKNIWGFHTLNDVMYFFSADLENGLALWKDDPINGVTLVKIVNPAENGIWHSSLSISEATNCGMIKVSDGSTALQEDTLYFFANDGINGTELWKSDGTDAGTIMVKDINPTGSSRWDNCHNSNSPWTTPVATGSMIYFWANDGTNGYELWKSDGTETGTVMVKDINSGVGSFGYSDIVLFGNTLFFSATNDPNRNDFQLWKSDGTETGTVMVKELDLTLSDGGELTVAGNTLFFKAWDQSYVDTPGATNKGIELWKTDGTEAGTVMVKDIYSGSSGSYGHSFTAFGDVYFVATDGANGYELWKSDGTETGTVMVKDINAGSSGSYPSQLTVVDNVLYFIADDGINGCKLWKSEGHESNTVMMNSTASHDCFSSGTDENYFLNFGASLYFRSDSGSSNSTGWVSDGTPERTNPIEGFNASDSVRATSEWLFIHGDILYIQVMSAPGIVTLVKISI